MIKIDSVYPFVSLYALFSFKPFDPENVIDKEIIQRMDVYQISSESALSCWKKQVEKLPS